MSLTSIVELGGISPGKTQVIIANLLPITFWNSVSRMGLASGNKLSHQHRTKTMMGWVGKREEDPDIRTNREDSTWRAVIKFAESARKQAM